MYYHQNLQTYSKESKGLPDSGWGNNVNRQQFVYFYVGLFFICLLICYANVAVRMSKVMHPNETCIKLFVRLVSSELHNSGGGGGIVEPFQVC